MDLLRNIVTNNTLRQLASPPHIVTLRYTDTHLKGDTTTRCAGQGERIMGIKNSHAVTSSLI